MVSTAAPTSPLARATAHLDAAVDRALGAARNEDDQLMSPWANVARDLNLAATALRQHLPDSAPPAEHGSCAAALHAAALELAQLRPELDIPLADLMLVMAQLAPALQHAAGNPESPGEAAPRELGPAGPLARPAREP